MLNRWLPASRAERLIAVTRFVLVAASLIATWVDPLEPAHHVAVTWTLLLAFCIYAFLALLASLFASRIYPPFLIATHVVDLLFFTVLNALTHGPSSPFFVYFVFSLVCAILRFARRGTILTAACAIFGFTMSGAWVALAEQSSAMEINHFIIRGVYLSVIASTFVYLASHQERTQGDLERLATWPRSTWGSREDVVRELLAYVTSVFGARGALLAYTHLGESSAWLGWRNDRGFASVPQRAATMEMALGAASAESKKQLSDVLADFSPDLRDVREMLTADFAGDFVRGKIILVDSNDPVLEEVSLAPLAGRLIATRLDHFHLTDQIRRGAVAEDRIRVARDLHDSVLQSLTGVALQLRTLPKVMTRDPEAARQRIAEIEDTIRGGQRELRGFIEELNPERSAVPTAGDLDTRIATLAERFSKQWQLDVDYEIDPMVQYVGDPLRLEIYSIVSEAVANSAKHADARKVIVRIGADATDVRIRIQDDGHGFPFHGRYDLPRLVEARRGPVTLKERVSSLGGEMVIDSSTRGADVDITIPIRGGTAE